MSRYTILRITTAVRIAVIAAIFSSAGFAGVGTAYAATPITVCGTISIPGAYQLQNNISATTTCLMIATSSVSIDGAGHTITGNFDINTQGVRAHNVSNLSISNLTVSTYGWGFDITNSTSTLLSNVTATSTYLGINVLNAASTTIASSTVSHTQSYFGSTPNSSRAIEIDGSSTTTITNLLSLNNLTESVEVIGGSNNTTVQNSTFTHDQVVIFPHGARNLLIQNNIIMNCTTQGMATQDSVTGLLFTNNTITGCDTGLDIEDTTGGNTYSNNTISNSASLGVAIYSPSNTLSSNTITNDNLSIDLENAVGNIITGNTVTGSVSSTGELYIYGAASSTISNNFFGSSVNGIAAYNSDNLIVSGNTIATSTSDGTYFQNLSGLSFTGNTFSNIAGHSIELINVDGTSSSTPVTVQNNMLSSVYSTINLVGSSGVRVLHNIIRSGYWISDNTGTNTYNDALTGNSYFFANGNPASSVYDITDGDANGYADHGASLPFDQALLGSTLWQGQGQDAHPATTIAYVSPSAPTPPAPTSGNSSSGSSGQMITPQHASTVSAQTGMSPSSVIATTSSGASAAICTPYLSLTSYIRYGANNEPDQVKKLQQFLNDKEGEHLAVDGNYSTDDVAAVKRFQAKYESEVLGVWGITEPTGYVYRTTLMKINSFYCSAAIICPAFTEYNSTTQNATSAEVGKTKELLSELAFYSGPMTDTFDAPLASALKNFQETFSATMLKPWGETSGTGYKYKTTDKFLNLLVGCKTPAVDLDGKGSFDY